MTQETMLRRVDPDEVPPPPPRTGLLLRVVPASVYVGRARMLVHRAMLVNRRTWMTVFSGFFAPVFSLLAALLIALAFAAVGMSASTFLRSWQDFDLVNLAVLPMFFFSTTFFPITVYPRWLQLVVECFPLYHGVALMRALTVGVVDWG